jgi:putative transposase
MLEREGIGMNHKKLRRLYGEEGLQVKRRRGRKRAEGTRVARELAAIVARRGKPRTIVSDNGNELTSRAILK